MEKEIENIKTKILEAISPRAIILFGSRAKGVNAPDSDYDICVLVNSDLSKRIVAQNLYKLFIDFNYPIDFIVEHFDKYIENINNNSLIYKEISQGLFLYEQG
jgi:predicted nucleotidyltransferase